MASQHCYKPANETRPQKSLDSSCGYKPDNKSSYYAGQAMASNQIPLYGQYKDHKISKSQTDYYSQNQSTLQTPTWPKPQIIHMAATALTTPWSRPIAPRRGNSLAVEWPTNWQPTLTAMARLWGSMLLMVLWFAMERLRRWRRRRLIARRRRRVWVRRNTGMVTGAAVMAAAAATATVIKDIDKRRLVFLTME